MKTSPTEPREDTEGRGAEKVVLLSRTTSVGDQRAGSTVVGASVDGTSPPPHILHVGMSQHGLSSNCAPGVAQPRPKTPTKYWRESEHLWGLGAHTTNVRAAYYFLKLSPAVRCRNLCPQNRHNVYRASTLCPPVLQK